MEKYQPHPVDVLQARDDFHDIEKKYDVYDVYQHLTFKYLPKNTPRLRHPEASHGIDDYDEISGGALPLPRHDFHWGNLRSKGEPASQSRRHHG